MTLKEINELKERAAALKAQRLGTTPSNINSNNPTVAQKLGNKVGNTTLWFKAFGPAFKLGYEQAMGSEVEAPKVEAPIIIIAK